MELEPLEIVLIAVGSVLFFCCCCISCIRGRKKHDGEKSQHQMLNIFKFLHAFDVDDIDIRRSPAGGFHATYLNDLAHGENRVPDFNDDGAHTGAHIGADVGIGHGNGSINGNSNGSSNGGETEPLQPGDTRPNMTHASVADDFLFMSKRAVTKTNNNSADDASATSSTELSAHL